MAKPKPKMSRMFSFVTVYLPLFLGIILEPLSQKVWFRSTALDDEKVVQ